jgi:hypothetical protein
MRRLGLAVGFALAAALSTFAMMAFADVSGASTVWSLVSFGVLAAFGAGVASHRLTGGDLASLAVSVVTLVFTAGWLALIFGFLLVAVYPPGN